jgi:hypothetical protein
MQDGVGTAGGRDEERGPGMATVEIGTSLLIIAIGAAAIWDSRRIGAAWGADGPQSGYFPFWIGLILVLASVGNLAQVARARAALRRESQAVPAPLFATWGQLRTVLSVLLPTAVYVAAIPFAGIYVASAALVTWFMTRLGGFAWHKAAPTGVAISLVAFVVFEIWFLVALPKGPIETALGF